MRDELATEHSSLRLMQRAREFDKTMTEMWDDGIPCHISGHGYDEARVCPEHRVVLLMENNKVVTILETQRLDVTVEGDYLQEYLERSIDG